MESNSVCNHTSDNKIGKTAQRESDLFFTSMITVQTELDETKSCYQLIIKITIFQKRRIAKLLKERENIDIKILTNEA